MSSWIFAIGADRTDNFRIAIEHGIWGGPNKTRVQRGDTIYFWQSRASFVGMAMAMSNTFEAANSSFPWGDGTQYPHRFHFTLLSDTPTAAPTWSEVQAALGTRAAAHTKPSFSEPHQEEALAGYFGGTTGYITTTISNHPLDVNALSNEDARRWADVRQAVREGRKAFHANVLHAYDHRCAVTGTKDLGTLEAAHIVRFLGVHSNDVRNGLPLRVDIHRLFDAGLLEIRYTGAYTILLADHLRGDETYGYLHGRQLNLPEDEHDYPSPEALSQHHAIAVGAGWSHLSQAVRSA